MPATILPIAERRQPKGIAALLRHDGVRRAFEFIDSSADRFTTELIRICEIPAPPFREHERGRYFAGRFAELGLSEVHTDSEGNVIGFYRGAGESPLIVVSASLKAANIGTQGAIAFVATVGEEGEGNLRGVRHLFSEGRLAHRVSAFISFDGPGVEYITHQALGSRRYRVTPRPGRTAHDLQHRSHRRRRVGQRHPRTRANGH
jgi:hypothetical protein